MRPRASPNAATPSHEARGTCIRGTQTRPAKTLSAGTSPSSTTHEPQPHCSPQSFELQHHPKHVHFDRSTTARSSEESAYASARSSSPTMGGDALSERSASSMKEQDEGNEHSPLLTARASDDELTLVPPMPTNTQTSPVRPTFDAQAHKRQHDSKSSWYLFLLTLSMLG